MYLNDYAWCIMKTLLDILSLLYSIFTTKRQCGRARKLIDYGMNINNFFMKSNYDLASADIASMSIPAVWTIATHTWANKHLSFASWAAIGPIAAWERKKLMGSGPWKRCSQKNKKKDNCTIKLYGSKECDGLKPFKDWLCLYFSKLVSIVVV